MRSRHDDGIENKCKSVFGGATKPRRNLALPPERELSQLAAPPKNQPLRIEDNPRSAGGQRLWRQCQVAPSRRDSGAGFYLSEMDFCKTANEACVVEPIQR
jgi:hypothetical protein